APAPAPAPPRWGSGPAPPGPRPAAEGAGPLAAYGRAMFSDTLLHPPPAPPADRLDAAIRDVMRPGVIVISAHGSLPRAQRARLSHGVHAILVLDDDGGRPLGWVTSRGLL